MVILFAESGQTRGRSWGQVDASIDRRDGPHALLPILERLLAAPNVASRETRKFPRYKVQLPFAVTVYHSGTLALLQGMCRDVGEGGLGGTIDGDLEPGECVLLLLSDPRLEVPLEPRAQVKYRRQNDYGFAFFDITATERAKVRWLCTEQAQS